MSRTPRRSSAAILSAVTVASLFGLAGPAAARGGTPAPPPPEPATLDCFGDFGDPTIPNMTEPGVAVNYAGDAACVGVRVTASGSVRLAWVVLAPGWTYVVKSDGTGTSNRVELRFTQALSGRKVDFRFERGRTTIG